MVAFRMLLGVLLVAVVVCTIPVVLDHGLILFSVFFGDIAEMNWPGQFNFDFLGFLILSATWVMWRNHFSPIGLLLGAIASVGGIPFLTTYLLIESFRVEGDLLALIFGQQRAAEICAG